jgi:thymidylate synthase (FAD)
LTNVIEPVKTEVHNHGHVILVDWMGDDNAIVDAARLSYGQGTVKRTDSVGLIRYLMRHRHTSPFEMVELKFQLKMPIFVARQWIRHRTANINEMSGRYSEMPNEFFVFEELSVQSQSNKQGRQDGVARRSEDFLRELEAQGAEAFALYYDMIDPEDDVAREQARVGLPLSTYTEFVWKIDLHNLFHFLKLRTDSHAQREIRDYATVLERHVADICPIAYQAWVDYSKEAHTFSKQEITLLRQIVTQCELRGGDVWVTESGMSAREVKEFREVLNIPAE